MIGRTDAPDSTDGHGMDSIAFLDDKETSKSSYLDGDWASYSTYSTYSTGKSCAPADHDHYVICDYSCALASSQHVGPKQASCRYSQQFSSDRPLQMYQDDVKQP